MLPIEYLEKQVAPELESCLEHDDWVSGIHLSDQHVLTGEIKIGLSKTVIAIEGR